MYTAVYTAPVVAAEGELMDTDGGARHDRGMSIVVGALTASAGLIHFSVISHHSGGDAIVPVGFMVVGLLQVGLAALLVADRQVQRALVASSLVNVGSLAVWIYSRTIGLPFDPYGGIPEAVGSTDLVAAGLEAGAVAIAASMLVAPGALRLPRNAAAMVASVTIVAASMVIVTPDNAPDTSSAADAGSGGGGGGGGGHHGNGQMAAAGSSDHSGEMLRIDRARCDLSFNPQAYWDEALGFGVDIYDGGNMAMPLPTPASGVAEVPLDGRGSEALDRMISLTTRSSGEVAAAELVAAISEASDEEYLAWRNWVANNPGAHSSTPTTTIPGQVPVATMGHPGPQTWRAMVDQEGCDQLGAELELARQTAARYPTAEDAVAAGWQRITPYLPGIGAHYMNYALVDGTFDIEAPEMLLFDGTDPESRIVGLSYYVRLEGNAAPTQGFIGENDVYHRHYGLCIGPGGVIGDSTTSEAACTAMGGRKAVGTDGWMSHAWVVPGCESPWGVFSGENPLLDNGVGQQSSQDGSEGCAGSLARERYDLSPGETDLLVRGAAPDEPEEAAGP